MSKHPLLGFVSNTLVFLAVGILDIVLFTSVRPHERGFFCDDESIKYPRLQKETISDTVLVLLIASPALVIILVEVCSHFIRPTTDEERNDTPITCGPFIVRQWQQRLINRVFTYGFGVLLNWLFTEACKLYVGSLRPYFLDVCQPNCNKYTNQSYIMGDVCKGDADLIKEARLSFPSGHASGAMYAMVFLALYIQVMLSRHCGTFLKPLLQAACLMVAFFCGLSRLQDLLHRWSDVLAGFLLGAVMALFHANKALKVFERGQRPEKMSEIPMYCTSCMDTIRSNGVDLEANMRKPTASSSVHEHSATNNLP